MMKVVLIQKNVIAELFCKTCKTNEFETYLYPHKYRSLYIYSWLARSFLVLSA